MHLGRMHIFQLLGLVLNINFVKVTVFFRSSMFLLTFLSNLPHPTFFFFSL